MQNKYDLDKVLCVLPKLDNPRIIRQHGAFFLFGIHEGRKNSMTTLVCSSIRFNIPAKSKSEILTQLDQLGINEKFCFTEIEKVHIISKKICNMLVDANKKNSIPTLTVFSL